MSAGNFVLSRYATGDATPVVYACRVQPETLAATIATVANAGATAAITGQGRIKLSAGRKAAQPRARKVTLAWTAAPPAGYKAGSTIKIPALTVAFYNACTIGAAGTYNGAAVQVVGRTPEIT